MKTWVGIDVSKLTLDACWFTGGNPSFLKVANDEAGFKVLLTHLPPFPHLVMEATGAYYLRLANFLMNDPLHEMRVQLAQCHAAVEAAHPQADLFPRADGAAAQGDDGTRRQ